MQVADPRKGKAVEPFRFAVGVTQMQGVWLKPNWFRVSRKRNRYPGDAGYDACIRSSKA